MRLRAALPTLCTALLASLIGASAAAAQPGDLDPSFGSAGVTGAAAQLLGVAVESDGSVVAAGQAGGRAVVDRFSPSGQLEGSWAGPGGYARGIAVEPGGDVVVSGQDSGALFVARLTSSLAPDGSFGSGGVATAFPGDGAGNGVAVEPDGSVVAAGGIAGTGFEVARFSTSGGLEWANAYDFGDLSFARGVAVQPDSKIVVVGQQRPGPAHQVTNGVIGRLNPDGSLDGGFASGGATTYFYPNTGYTSLSAVAVQNDGRLDVAGVSAGGPTAFFVRYNSDGSLDQSFGTGGAAGLPAGQNILVPVAALGPYGVAIAGGGRIVSAGAFGNTGTGVDAADWAVTATGAPATDFADSGTARGPSATWEACAVAVAPDGSIVTVGGAVSSFPDNTPCTPGSTSSGFVSRRIGYGPPPSPSSGSAPSASTGAATAVKTTTATLTGAINPNGLATTYYFEYGKSTAYGSNTASGTLAAGTSSDSVSATLSKLAPSTTYHFALVATNADGRAVGSDMTFKTPAAPPALTVKLRGISSSYKIASVGAHGVAFKVTCNTACSVRASLLVSAKLAKRLGLGSRQTAVATGSASIRSAGTVKVTLHLTSKARKPVGRSSKLAVTLRVVTTPAGGGSARTTNKAVTLKR